MRKTLLATVAAVAIATGPAAFASDQPGLDLVNTLKRVEAQVCPRSSNPAICEAEFSGLQIKVIGIQLTVDSSMLTAYTAGKDKAEAQLRKALADIDDAKAEMNALLAKYPQR